MEDAENTENDRGRGMVVRTNRCYRASFRFMALISHPMNSVTGLIIGAAVAVHRNPGPGLLESAYQACLDHELDLRDVEHDTQVPLPVWYKNTRLDCGYRLDFVVKRCVIVEVKSVDRLQPIHESQVLTYLRLTHLAAALLINFNVRSLRHGIRRLLA
jgi:GxxExxY protein